MSPSPRPKSPRRRRPKKSRLGLFAGLAILVLLVAYVAVLELSRPHVAGDRLRFDTFMSLARDGRIKDVRLLDQDSYAVGRYIGDDRLVTKYNTPLLRDSQRDLVEVLLTEKIPTTIDQQVGKRVASLASVLLPGLILIVLFVYMLLSYRSGTGLFGIRSGARRVRAEDIKVTFADVAGQEAAVAELREVKEFLTDPERFAALGAAVPKGILLFGPPGCGKTMVARALAGEAKAAFYSISGSDFVEVYVGVGASRVRDLFAEARANAPALIFIDELDSIGRSRGTGSAMTANSEQEQALNQILAEMDGFSSSEGVIVIGATNRADILDPALLRPGRFDRTIGLDRPGEADRLAILEVHAQNKPFGGDVDLADIARRAIGLTGADLANVVNEAALIAARSEKVSIGGADFDQALQRILQAPERQRRLSLRKASIGKRFASEDRATFADVAGVDDAVEELAEIKEYLAEPDRFAHLGARSPKGILLVGPPGCGKTLLARALAGEANAAFFSVAGSEFVEVFAGEGASRVRELFAEARSVAPAIVFIDEIDAVGSQRSAGAMGGQREMEQTLNQVLVELDGFEPNTGVILMAATNRPDVLDPALLRPGRIDRQVEIALPGRAGRQAILELHSKDMPLGADVDLDVVAGLSRGFSGADLANVLNEAALLAGRRGAAEIPMALVEEGLDRATEGIAARGHVVSDEERRVIAYHESGHALVALALPHATPPHKLTLVARPRSLGHVRLLDSHDRLIRSRSMLLDDMAVLLAGRAAEQIVFGEGGTGASGDLAQANEIARQMVSELGMSNALGALTSTAASVREGRSSLSEETERTMDREARLLLDEAEARAHAALAGGRAGLDRVASALLEQETLSVVELEALAAAGRRGQRSPAREAALTAPPASRPV